jgi:hypothetical protein
MSGKANGQALFMGGKLKIAGNMMMAMKLSELTKSLNAAPKAAAPLAAVFAQVRILFKLFSLLSNYHGKSIVPMDWKKLSFIANGPRASICGA